MIFSDIYCGKKVMVTGHTGFKGSWLSEWLCMLGAEVIGFSLKPDPETDFCHTRPAHFDELDLQSQLAAHIEGDIRDFETVEATIRDHEPDFIFHLAAQPLVLRSFEAPHLTVETNVRGNLNILEAVRRSENPCVLVMITTDKVYENLGWLHAYREIDRLGGHDPYSASKAAAELVIASYWNSFFSREHDDPNELGVAVAPVRGGNAIGGGDWADNRIIPDAMKAIAAGEPFVIRNSHATRPWQHVLELLSGYLHLGTVLFDRREKLYAASELERESALNAFREVCAPFNFGPLMTSNQNVGYLVNEIFKNWPGTSHDHTDPDAPPEDGKLNLAIDRAYHVLGWKPHWSFEETIRQTVEWYREFYEQAQGNPKAVRRLTQNQIRRYSKNLNYSNGG